MKKTVLALCAFGLFGCAPYPVQSTANDITLVDTYAEATSAQLKTKKESAVIAATKETAKQNLKDPESAQFRNVRIVPWGKDKVVCGEINAKNSYGGYVGFKKFVGSPSRVTIEPSNTKGSGYDAQLLRDMNQACGG